MSKPLNLFGYKYRIYEIKILLTLIYLELTQIGMINPNVTKDKWVKDINA